MPIGAIIGDFASDGQPRFYDSQRVRIAGVVSSSRTRPTRNNSLMCYVQFEDDTGSIELVVFQKVLDTCGGYIANNAALMVSGRISVRDEKEPQITVDDLAPIDSYISPAPGTVQEGAVLKSERVRYSATSEHEQGDVSSLRQKNTWENLTDKTLYIRVSSAGDSIMHRIELLLTMFPGTGKLVIWCEKEKKRVGAKCLLHPALFEELIDLLGNENVVIK